MNGSFMRSIAWCAWLCLLVRAVPAQESTATRLILASETISPALLTDINQEGQLVFQSTSEHRNAELKSIVRWSPPRAIQPSAAVWLRDGSWLSGSIQWLSEGSLRLNSEWFEAIEFKFDDLRGILLRPSPSYQQTLELHSQLSAVTGSADTIWSPDGQQLQGVLSIQWRASSVVAPGRPLWFLKPGNSSDLIELRDSDLMAIAFSPVLRKSLDKKSDAPVVTMRDGSRLHVTKFNRLSNQRLQVELSDGFKLETLDSIDQFLPAIAAIQATPSHVQWLSDLEPARYRLLDSHSSLNWPLGRDVDLYGKRLWAGGLPVHHSLVVHSPAQVAYRWDGRAARFLSEVQLLNNPGSVARPLGSARCQVLLARQGELKSAYRSDLIRVGDAPQQVDIDIEGAQLVVLLVEEADQGPQGDHLLWREARLVARDQK